MEQSLYQYNYYYYIDINLDKVTEESIVVTMDGSRHLRLRGYFNNNVKNRKSLYKIYCQNKRTENRKFKNRYVGNIYKHKLNNKENDKTNNE